MRMHRAGAIRQEESAAVFLLKTPNSLPGSNNPSQWAPDNSECKWAGKGEDLRRGMGR